jgi:hypothetical protein
VPVQESWISPCRRRRRRRLFLSPADCVWFAVRFIRRRFAFDTDSIIPKFFCFSSSRREKERRTRTLDEGEREKGHSLVCQLGPFFYYFYFILFSWKEKNVVILPNRLVLFDSVVFLSFLFIYQKIQHPH